MGAEKSYPVAAVARAVGVPSNTIRSWCKVYADHLSTDANPAPGTERRFNDRDLAVLKLVAQLRREGFPPDEVAERLQQTTVTAGEIIAPSAPAVPSPSPDITPADPALLPVPSQQITDLAARVERLESGGPAAVRFRWAAVGFAAGVVLAAVVIIAVALLLIALR